MEPEHTQLLFAVSHLGFSTYYGRFAGASGTLDFRPGALTASTVVVSVPVASVSTTSPELTAALKGPKWFDAARFPSLVFRSTGASVLGRDQGTVTGELTMHGVTRPVTLKVRFNGAGYNPLDHKYTVGFEASGIVHRRDFGIDAYEPLIGDDVELILSAAFEKR
jgi:polyisoprenoid-binding protein YceI